MFVMLLSKNLHNSIKYASIAIVIFAILSSRAPNIRPHFPLKYLLHYRPIFSRANITMNLQIFKNLLTFLRKHSNNNDEEEYEDMEDKTRKYY